MPRSGRKTGGSLLSRSNSCASSFAKSTVVEDYQRIGSNIARQHAIAAANVAYYGSNGLVDEFTSDEGVRTPACFPNALRRTQSVRFTGPNSNVPPPRSITRRIAQNLDHRSRMMQLSPPKSHRTDCTKTPLLDERSRVRKSSYKKVKKSKSMFLPKKHQIISTPTYSPSLRKKHSRLSDKLPYDSCSPNRGRTSAGELLRLLPNPHQTTYSQDEAIRIAQEKYRRDLEKQRCLSLAKDQLGAVSLSAHDGTHEGSMNMFSKIARETGENQYDSFDGAQSLPEISKSKGKRLRKSSASLASKIRKFFRRKSSKTIPAQQIFSQRQHWDNPESELQEEASYSVPVLPLSDENLTRHVRSRQSSSSSLPRAQDAYRSFSAPVDDGDEPEDDGSRVTSWANSTATNETTQNENVAERKRLTVIEENDDTYRPSTSTNVGQVPIKPRYNAFRWPRKPGIINEPVDSHDIYVALQNRMDEAKSRRRNRQNSESSMISRRFSLRRKASHVSSVTGGTEPGIEQRNLSTKIDNRTTSDISRGDGFNEGIIGEDDSIFSPESYEQNIHNSPYSEAGARISSLPDIGSFEEKKSKQKKKTLRETRSSFFPSQRKSKDTKLSPSRLTLRSSSKDKTKMFRKGSMSSFLRRKKKAPSEHNDSDSVYSRQITGTPSGFPAHLGSSDSVAGFVTGFAQDSQTIAKQYSDLIAGEPNSGSFGSGDSTTDGKARTVAQVTGLEGVEEEDPDFNVNNNNHLANEQEISYDRQPAATNTLLQSSLDTRPIPPVVASTSENGPPRSFDYGFATSNIIRQQALAAYSKLPNRNADQHSFCERPDQRNLPLTERNFSQSNRLCQGYHHQLIESLPSYRNQPSKNQVHSSSMISQSHFPNIPKQVYTTRDEAEQRSRAWSPSENNRLPSAETTHSASYALNSQTVVIRRRSRGQSQQLRRIQSSASLRDNSESGSYIDLYGPDLMYKHREENRSGTPDSLYDISGTGMLGPPMATAKHYETEDCVQNRAMGRDERGFTPVFL